VELLQRISQLQGRRVFQATAPQLVQHRVDVAGIHKVARHGKSVRQIIDAVRAPVRDEK